MSKREAVFSAGRFRAEGDREHTEGCLSLSVAVMPARKRGHDVVIHPEIIALQGPRSTPKSWIPGFAGHE